MDNTVLCIGYGFLILFAFVLILVVNRLKPRYRYIETKKLPDNANYIIITDWYPGFDCDEMTFYIKNIGSVKLGMYKRDSLPPYMVIYNLYVDKDYRRQGYGTYLLNTARKEAQKYSYVIRLNCVKEGYEWKSRFYLNNGFKQIPGKNKYQFEYHE